jgi:hypothetical protein
MLMLLTKNRSSKNKKGEWTTCFGICGESNLLFRDACIIASKAYLQNFWEMSEYKNKIDYVT